MTTNADVRTYIAGLTTTELTTLISELKADFVIPATVTFADTWILNANGGDHSHQISINDAQLEDLKSGDPVVVTTWTNQGHTHEVTLTYAAGVVSVSIQNNHVTNPHTLTNSNGGSVVTEYIPVG